MLISGDTRFSENLIRHGMGVDLLVHAIAGSKPELLQNIIVRRILDHHTLPPAAATVFNRTRPKLAVYTHIVLQQTERFRRPLSRRSLPKPARPIRDRCKSVRT